MLKKFSLLLVVFLYSLQSFAFVLNSSNAGSYIYVREESKDVFEILYCKEGAEECVNLGARKNYTRSELESLKLMEIGKTVATGALAVSAGFVTAWLGFTIGGAVAIAAGGVAIQGAIVGTAGGVAITGTTISNLDKLNPAQHFSAVKMISKFDTDKISVVNDVEKQAIWLRSRLLLID